MKKIILSLILIFSLTLFANNDPILNIPDANFKAKLLEASPSNQIASTQTPIYNPIFLNWNVSSFNKIDINNDGEIQVSEALLIKYLKLNSSSILNLDGIQNFTNLQYLDCSFNQLSSLNVQGLINLQYYDCSNNQLPSLNVQGLTNLQYLACANNQLPSLNVQGLTNLKNLYCSWNQLPNINLQDLINLQSFVCNNNQITNLNLQGLTNLKYLSCPWNQISSLNVQGLTNLEELQCYENQLSSLDLQGLTNLKTLKCSNNQLPSLNLQGLTNLQVVECYISQLISLNVQGLTNLLYLSCFGNQLTTLNVQGLTNLADLRCDGNQLTSLNVQGLPNLQRLDCYNNQLTSLNVQGLPNLQRLDCYNNQLTSLFIKNERSNISNYKFFNNPNLQYICCSDNQITQVQQRITQSGYNSNCQVNTYCSFTPGGNFNTISGQFKFDFENNGCDANDFPFINAKLSSPSFTGSNTVFTNNQGQYNGYVLQGAHTLTAQLENPTLFNITPPFAQITFANSNNNTQTQNFCITPVGNHMDVEVICTPLNPARPGFDADYKLVYRNIGNQPSSGQVTLNFMNDRIDLVASSLSPTNQTANQLLWSYQDLLPFETRSINITFNVNSPTETPPVNNGDILNFTANITPVSADINPLNNNFVFNQTVVGSYDPNDKTCLQGNTPGPEFIDQYVHYLIRFENTGTFFAQNVVVRDEIDLAKFDINSLVVLNASHSMLNTRILNGNRVEFIFEGIQLPFPPSQLRHGYVLFKIKTKSNLMVGSTFSNKANIYFDYNWPIITNDEVSTITLLGQPSFEFSEYVSLYPNPANDMINISAKAGINLQSIEIYNTIGQLLMALPNDSNERSIDVSHLNSGTYMINVNNDKGKGHTMFIKK